MLCPYVKQVLYRTETCFSDFWIPIAISFHTSLKNNYIFVESGVTMIGYGAFQNSSRLTNVSIPESAIIISSYVHHIILRGIN